VEPANCFWALLDYIHLNPVRAGLVNAGDGIESYRWSSLREYIAVPQRRSHWQETEMGFTVTGSRDTPSGRREFLEILEMRVDWKDPGRAGAVYCEGEGKPKLAVHSALRRGWFFGSQEFRDVLLKLASKRLTERAKRKADGYQGVDLRDHGERRAKRILEAGLEHFGVNRKELLSAAKGDWRKGLLAALIQKEATVRLDWISFRRRVRCSSRRSHDTVTGCRDTPSGRREFLDMLEMRVDWKNPGRAGAVYCEGEGKPNLSVHSVLRRGWFFASQEFRDMLFKLASKRLTERAKRKADGYQGVDLRDHGERRAKRILEAGLEHFGVNRKELLSAAKGDWRKGLLAAIIHTETTVRLDWISESMRMGERSSCCRTIRRTREMTARRKDWIETTKQIRNMTTNHD